MRENGGGKKNREILSNGERRKSTKKGRAMEREKKKRKSTDCSLTAKDGNKSTSFGQLFGENGAHLLLLLNPYSIPHSHSFPGVMGDFMTAGKTLWLCCSLSPWSRSHRTLLSAAIWREAAFAIDLTPATVNYRSLHKLARLPFSLSLIGFLIGVEIGPGWRNPSRAISCLFGENKTAVKGPTAECYRVRLRWRFVVLTLQRGQVTVANELCPSVCCLWCCFLAWLKAKELCVRGFPLLCRTVKPFSDKGSALVT